MAGVVTRDVPTRVLAPLLVGEEESEGDMESRRALVRARADMAERRGGMPVGVVVRGARQERFAESYVRERG